MFAVGFLGILTAIALPPGPAYAAPPANDDFANAEVIVGPSGSVSGTTLEATGEAGGGEVELSGAIKSIWYSWTAPADDRIAFDTCGSGYDTYVGIYSGAALNSLTQIASSDDTSACGSGLDSRISLDVTAGTIYSIQVDGFVGDAGPVQLNWMPVVRPPNDDFADAEIISGPTGTVAGSTLDATSQDGVGETVLSPPTHSVWYSWTAPTSGPVSFDTCGSGFDTFIAVYVGPSLDALGEVGRNDDGGACVNVVASELEFSAAAGTVYAVQVDGYANAAGDLQLNWGQAPDPPPDDTVVAATPTFTG